MDYRKEYLKIMTESINISLATSIDNKPNVRVVSFAFDKEVENVVYFTTFPDSPKIEEMKKNNIVAFSTLTDEKNVNAHVRVKNAKVSISDKDIDFIAPIILSKYADYQETLDMAKDILIIYEIIFDDAIVIKDMQNIGSISF